MALGVTIYEALVRKLGRHPTNAEVKADVKRIMRDALTEAASKGALRHQRRRGKSRSHFGAPPVYEVEVDVRCPEPRTLHVVGPTASAAVSKAMRLDVGRCRRVGARLRRGS